MKKKKKNKKFLELEIKEEKYFTFCKSKIIALNAIKYISKPECDFFILIEENNFLNVYDKENISLLQKIKKKINDCIILDNNNILIFISNNLSEIYSKSNGDFKFLKNLTNFPKITNDILYTFDGNIIVSTKNTIQIWNTKNKLPLNCITIIHLRNNITSFFLMKNKNILVVNGYEYSYKCSIFFDMKKLKILKKYFASPETDNYDNLIGFEALKINENIFIFTRVEKIFFPCGCPQCSFKEDKYIEKGINFNKTIKDIDFKSRLSFKRIIKKLPKHKTLFNLNEINDDEGIFLDYFDCKNQIIVFEERNLFLLYDKFIIKIFDLTSFINIKNICYGNDYNIIKLEKYKEKYLIIILGKSGNMFEDRFSDILKYNEIKISILKLS